MTEDEARKKWCPMVNFEIGPSTPTWQGIAYTNRGQEYDPLSCRCEASDCMWWAWTGNAFDEDTETMVDIGKCGAIK